MASPSRATRSRPSTPSGSSTRSPNRAIPSTTLRMFAADGHQIMEIPTPPMGGDAVPPTMGALRSHVAGVLARHVEAAGVDVRLGTTVTEISDDGDSVTVRLTDGSTETFDLLVAADGIRSKTRGHDRHRHPAAHGRHGHLAGGRQAAGGDGPAPGSTTAARSTRPGTRRSRTTSATPSCSRATSTALYVGEHPNGAVLKERGPGVRRDLGRGARQPGRRRSRSTTSRSRRSWSTTRGTAAARSSSVTRPTPARR